MVVVGRVSKGTGYSPTTLGRNGRLKSRNIRSLHVKVLYPSVIFYQFKLRFFSNVSTNLNLRELEYMRVSSCERVNRSHMCRSGSSPGSESYTTSFYNWVIPSIKLSVVVL